MDYLSFPIDLDQDGFLWRQCEACNQKFKWHHGPIDSDSEIAEMDPRGYYCPYCATQGDPSSWFTEEQLQTAKQYFLPAANRALRDALKPLEKRNRNSFISVELEISDADVPLTVAEADDPELDIILSPCHPSEPLKVYLPEDQKVHCLVCGLQFTV